MSDDDGTGEIICDGSDEEFDVELKGEDEHDNGQESNDNSSDESSFDVNDGDEFQMSSVSWMQVP